MNTTNRAAEIRKALKAAGISPSAVSVRSRETSLSANITVMVLNCLLGLEIVKGIVLPFADVTPGLGGNTFVNVSYAPGVAAERQARLAAMAEATAILIEEVRAAA